MCVCVCACGHGGTPCWSAAALVVAQRGSSGRLASLTTSFRQKLLLVFPGKTTIFSGCRGFEDYLDQRRSGASLRAPFPLISVASHSVVVSLLYKNTKRLLSNRITVKSSPRGRCPWRWSLPVRQNQSPNQLCDLSMSLRLIRIVWRVRGWRKTSSSSCLHRRLVLLPPSVTKIIRTPTPQIRLSTSLF